MSAGRTAPTRADLEIAPAFSVSPPLLDALGPPVRSAGVVLGADPDGEPVVVDLLRPAPTRVVLLGGLYLARQVTLRAVGTGAHAVVVTGRPPVWDAVRESAGPFGEGAEDVVRILREAPGDLAVGHGPPLLVVHDRGATARGPAPARRPHQTTLVVLPSLVPAVSDLADDADLVLIQRLPPHEAELAGRLWRLTPAMTETLRTLPDRGAVLLGRNLWRRVDLVTGPRETAILGPVRRGD
ncbi:hypothetical protein Acsp06_07960 [Actinomycetospora sp. NBRC 106375]|uniref:hypothetical protein n=1 Tax=Actinomycetospora sp. NBRC 106375 TaxID=3032207 RepID=UPI0024A06B05|nr:hypothetical protein [Actinomycetospora sp. NBRC 106375]GLZ44611.1 hypothetical protein Acsp06_07960 [Actinomycetospora sp. NBRC 106375]